MEGRATGNVVYNYGSPSHAKPIKSALAQRKRAIPHTKTEPVWIE